MSRPSFRPRPIDINKPLPVVKSNRDLKHDEDIGVVARALPAMATGVDPTEEVERHLQQALLASMYADSRRSLSEIPIPIVNEVKLDTTFLERFKLPETYLVVEKADNELDRLGVEYEADEKDEAFVSDLNARRNVNVTLDKFEEAMDKLEKLQGRSTGLLPFSVLRGALSDKHFASVGDAVRRDVFAHWVERRDKERKGRPFLRFLQQPPDVNDPNPAVAFRQRNENVVATGRFRQARQNSYDNYKRLAGLRNDFARLRTLASNTVYREKVKKERSEARVELARARVIGHLLPEKVNAAHDARTIADIKKRTGMTDKFKDGPAAKKRKVSTMKAVITDKSVDSLLTTKAGIDQFSFDEKGRTFLRQTRYVAGLFATNGVSCYDHRVFTATSERNAVKDIAKEPKLVDLSSMNKFVDEPEFGALKVRPRMGRLGRVMFDVLEEGAQPPRYPTYAASVTAGGAYLAGIPYDCMPELKPIGATDEVTTKFRPAGLENMLTDADSKPSAVRGGLAWPRRQSAPQSRHEPPTESPTRKEEDDEYAFFLSPRRPLVLEVH